jgi:hypothetical protein
MKNIDNCISILCPGERGLVVKDYPSLKTKVICSESYNPDWIMNLSDLPSLVIIVANKTVPVIDFCPIKRLITVQLEHGTYTTNLCRDGDLLDFYETLASLYSGATYWDNVEDDEDEDPIYDRVKQLDLREMSMLQEGNCYCRFCFT